MNTIGFSSFVSVLVSVDGCCVCGNGSTNDVDGFNLSFSSIWVVVAVIEEEEEEDEEDDDSFPLTFCLEDLLYVIKKVI